MMSPSKRAATQKHLRKKQPRKQGGVDVVVSCVQVEQGRFQVGHGIARLGRHAAYLAPVPGYPPPPCMS